MRTIVVENYPEPDVKLDFDFGTAGEYAGFDRFGRVVDQRWYDYGASEVRDQYRYGYDRASNRLYRENTLASAKDEFYTYDGMKRLVTFDRGDLDLEKSSITGTPVCEEDWSLDMTGNWFHFVQKTSGTTGLDQARTHNGANETTAIAAMAGTNWADPVHDRAGNMTTIPKPSDLAHSLTAKYDAWNRLVEVEDGAIVVGEYRYDGRNRCVCRDFDSGAPASPAGVDTHVHCFYNNAWQALETRESNSATAKPESIKPKYQYVWSECYIDAPILRDENTDTDSLCDDERFYYLHDAHFDVTTLVDDSGNAVERYEYAPYGNVTIYDGTWLTIRPTSNYENSVLCTGREHHAESGFYHYRNRYCNAELGRFLSRDPIAYSTGTNLHCYGAGSPLANVDPFGLEEEAPVEPDPDIGIIDIPPNWTPPDFDKYPPDSWLSETCRSVCKEARENDLNLHENKYSFGMVICAPNGSTRCPCFFDLGEGQMEPAVKWNECPELSWCVFLHEMAHVKYNAKDMVCDPACSSAHPAKGPAAPAEEVHKKIHKQQLDCLKSAKEKVKYNQDYPLDRRARCMTFATMTIDSLESKAH